VTVMAHTLHERANGAGRASSTQKQALALAVELDDDH
jgi:hypothetical protein